MDSTKLLLQSTPLPPQPTWVRLQILIRHPPQSPWRPKRKRKKVVEGSVSLTFIMIKGKPVYPYNTLSLKHSGPPRHHRHTFFLQPISHREPHLHRVQPQRGGARGERRCQEQLTPPEEHPTLYFVLSFSLFTGRFHQGLLRQAVAFQAFFSISLRDAPCDRSAVWMRPMCDGGNVSVKVAEESQGWCYRTFQVFLSNYILLFGEKRI